MTEVQADDHFAEAGEMVQPLAGWTPTLRVRCAARCAFYGDPPCWRIPDISCDPLPGPITPCDDCLHDRPNPDEEWRCD